MRSHELVWRGVVSMGEGALSTKGSLRVLDRVPVVERVQSASRQIGEPDGYGGKVEIVPIKMSARFIREGIDTHPEPAAELSEATAIATHYTCHPDGNFKIKYSFWVPSKESINALREAILKTSGTTLIPLELVVFVEKFEGKEPEDYPETV